MDRRTRFLICPSRGRSRDRLGPAPTRPLRAPRPARVRRRRPHLRDAVARRRAPGRPRPPRRPAGRGARLAGAAGLGLAAASAAGLWRLHRDAEASEQVLEDALVEALGPGTATRSPSRSPPRRPPPIDPPVAAAADVRPPPRYTAPDGRDLAYGDAGRRNRLDIWRRADLPDDAGAPGAAPGPRRGVGDRPEGGAGASAHGPPGRPGLGVRHDQLPPQPPSDVARAHRRRQAGHRLDPRRIADNGGDPDFLAISGGSAGAISRRSPR